MIKHAQAARTSGNEKPWLLIWGIVTVVGGLITVAALGYLALGPDGSAERQASATASVNVAAPSTVRPTFAAPKAGSVSHEAAVNIQASSLQVDKANELATSLRQAGYTSVQVVTSDGVGVVSSGVTYFGESYRATAEDIATTAGLQATAGEGEHPFIQVVLAD